MKAVRLGDIALFVRNGKSVKQGSSQAGLPITRIETIADGDINPDKVGFADLGIEGNEEWLLKDGDILISHINSTKHLGKCAQYSGHPVQIIHGMNLLNLRCNQDRAFPRYVLHFLKSETFLRQIPRITKNSVNQSSFTVSAFKELGIYLPPLPEQKRIAAILDKADEIRRKREKAIELTDSFLRSVFLEMFGDPVTNTKGWEQFTLGELVDFKTGKLDSNAAVPDGKYPFFTCARETYWIDTFAFDCKALLLAGNNAEGKYSVKLYEGKFNAYQRTYVMTLKRSELNYEYLKYVIESKLNFLRHHSKGTNTKYLTLALLQSIKIQVPDRSLQDQFARLFDKISKQLAERYQQSSSLLESLASSLNFHVFDQSRSDKPQQFATKEEAYAL